MRLGVDIRKLNILSCVYHVKCLAEMKLVYSSDKDFEDNVMGNDPVFQDYDYCCLVISV